MNNFWISLSGVALGGFIALIGQLVNNQANRKLIKFELRFSSFHEFATAINKSLRGGEKLLRNIEKYESVKELSEKVNRESSKIENAIIAVSKIPNSGLSEILDSLDNIEDIQNYHFRKPSDSIRRIIHMNGTESEHAHQELIDKLDDSLKNRDLLLSTLIALKSEVEENQTESESLKRDMDSALSNLQLTGASDVITLAQNLSSEISQWLDGKTSKDEVLALFSTFMAKANSELYESTFRQLIFRRFGKKSKFDSLNIIPNLEK